MIQAIETHYKGYRFRSRLEARWAVFFDAIKIQWSYEVEGFRVSAPEGKPVFYLPDFFLPEVETFVEVKPFSDPFKMSHDELHKIMSAVGFGGLDILLLGGSDMMYYRGTLLLGNDETTGQVKLIDGLQFSTCLLCNTAGLYSVPEEEGPSVFRCFNSSCRGYDHLHIKRHVDWITPQIISATTSAHSARFEHGETPRVPRGKPRK